MADYDYADDVTASAISGNQFEPTPEGLHQAVCVDIIDQGMVSTKFGISHKVRLIWQVIPDSGQMQVNGKRFQVSGYYTNSLFERSTLGRLLESWRGRKFTDEEKAGFKLKNLLGVNCMLQIVHNPKTDGTGVWANIMSVMPWKPSFGPTVEPLDYVRPQKKDAVPFDNRIVNSAPPTAQVALSAPTTGAAAGDDDIPF